MPNLMDMCESLVQEGRLAQNYVKFQKTVKDKNGKAKFEELLKLSKKQMEILLNIIKEGKWVVK